MNTVSVTPTTPETDPVGSAISEAQPGTALALVGTLKVQGCGPMTGYTRAVFGPAWTDTDRNGCDPQRHPPTRPESRHPQGRHQRLHRDDRQDLI